MYNPTITKIMVGVVVTVLSLDASVTSAQSLLKKIKEKAAQTATGKILDQTDKAVSAGLDKTVSNKTSSEEIKPSSSIKAFSKFDFVPGESISYVNDFSGEAVGELPAGWNSNGSSVIVKLDGMDGNWLRMAQRTVCLSDNKKMLGVDFTAEFDLFLQIDFKGWLPPSLRFGLLATGKDDPTGNSLLQDPKGDKSFYVEVAPMSNGANLALESYRNHTRYFHTSPHNSTLASKWYGKIVHVSIQGQKERLRIWMDGDKIYDVPKAIPSEGNFNQLYFQLSSSPYENDQIGVYISNIRLADGLPDLRTKLIEQGKFSTTGILFDTGSADIKPASTGVLKSIADVLTQNSDLEVRIIGHTDATGDEKTNQQLSERRANAVKENLQKVYGIAGERLQAAGKGQSNPVADNKTKEGMAQNRRVEFVRI